jgi:hypothetical protein
VFFLNFSFSGPVYTERVLYVRVNKDNSVEGDLIFVCLLLTVCLLVYLQVCDTLDLGFADSVSSLDSGARAVSVSSGRRASDAARYTAGLAQHNGDVPRFNADTRGESDCVRSEGHVLVLASVHQTWPKPTSAETLLMATGNIAFVFLCWVFVFFFFVERFVGNVSAAARCHVGGCGRLSLFFRVKTKKKKPPIFFFLFFRCRYMNREAVTVVDRAGRALCLSLNQFGVGVTLARLWSVKQSVEGLRRDLPERLLFAANDWLPDPLGGELGAVVRVSKRKEKKRTK